MSLSYNKARCSGQQCPSANNCRRYTERHVPKGVIASFAALYLRREAGDSACDQFIPVEVVSTFEREPETPEPLAPVVPLFKEGDK